VRHDSSCVLHATHLGFIGVKPRCLEGVEAVLRVVAVLRAEGAGQGAGCLVNLTKKEVNILTLLILCSVKTSL